MADQFPDKTAAAQHGPSSAGASSHVALRDRVISAFRIGHVDPQQTSLFDFRRVWIFPEWIQVSAVVALFLATVFCTHAEYKEKGTVFGFPGPGFNALFVPIYEELIFRGWILGKLVRHRSNLFAIAVSSLLFGLLHIRNIYWLEPNALVRSMIFTGVVLSPILGYVTLRFRSVWPAVILHYLNNLAYYLR